MDFEGGAELNGWLYGLTDQPLTFYEGMRGYLSSEGDSESLAMLADWKTTFLSTGFPSIPPH